MNELWSGGQTTISFIHHHRSEGHSQFESAIQMSSLRTTSLRASIALKVEIKSSRTPPGNSYLAPPPRSPDSHHDRIEQRLVLPRDHQASTHLATRPSSHDHPRVTGNAGSMIGMHVVGVPLPTVRNGQQHIPRILAPARLGWIHSRRDNSRGSSFRHNCPAGGAGAAAARLPAKQV